VTRETRYFRCFSVLPRIWRAFERRFLRHSLARVEIRKWRGTRNLILFISLYVVLAISGVFRRARDATTVRSRGGRSWSAATTIIAATVATSPSNDFAPSLSCFAYNDALRTTSYRPGCLQFSARPAVLDTNFAPPQPAPSFSLPCSQRASHQLACNIETVSAHF
jgi:hypothetical protein